MTTQEPNVLESLRAAGLEDWQIARAFVVLERGGTVQEARAALYDAQPAAEFDALALLADLRRFEERVEVEAQR